VNSSLESHKDVKASAELKVSVVVPVFNEQGNVEQLHEKLAQVLATIGMPCEIIFIDDGSTDGTCDILKKLCSRDERVKAIIFRRNFGQSAALSAGFRYAKGEIVITIDGDLQNDPSDILKLLSKLNEGYDVVCGWRRHRMDPLFSKRLPSKISNYLISKLLKLGIHDSGCTLRAHRRQVTEDLDIYGEMHRHIPAWASMKGYSITEVEVNHRPRVHGKTKYGMFRVFGGVADLANLAFIQRFGTRPGHIFNSLGIASFIFGIALMTILLLADLILHISITLSVLYAALTLILGGVQFVTIGMLSEIMTRIRYHLEGKAFYSIKEVIEGKR